MSTELIIAGEMGKGGSGPVEGVDTLISRQTVKTLFVVGEGVISEIEEVYLDTVSIDRFDADLLTRTGTAGQEVIEGFTDTEAPLPGFVGKVIDKGDENIPNVDISPLVTTNITNFVVNKFYRITSLGNATSEQWMAIGAGTKYVPAAIGMVFKAKKAGVGVTGAGVEKVSFQANTYETAIPYDVNRARLTFTIPVMLHVDGDGNTGGSAVEVDIYTRPNSTANWNLVANFTKKGKTTHGYTFDKEVTRPSSVNPNNKIPWEIKVLRVTDDSATNDSKTQNKISWSAVTQIYDTTNTYPNSALAGITLRDASQFGNKVPEIMFKVKGKLVLVPSNYNAATRVYTGSWTGSWYSVLGVITKVYTNNPAWIIYDVLTDTRAGLGLSQADIDIYSIYLLGKYADELIPYTEGINNIQIPRYTLDYSFQTRQPVRDFLSQILSICNANLITNELGQVAIVFQYPGQVVRRNIANANVVDGIFTYQSSNIEQRTTLVNVTYNNGKNFGRTDTATVFEQDLIDRYGLQPIDVVLPGCYYEAQAIRKARWTLYSNCHFTNFVTFNVFLDGLNYKIGDLVRVYDNYNQNTQQAGTIASYFSAGGTTTVIFDRTLTLNDGSYTFYCYDTSGVEVTKTLSVAGSIATATTVAIPSGTTNYPDYDYQGYVTKYGIPATGVHLTDEFKLPSHITFSTDSIYSSTNFLGGTWTGSGTTWHFYPSIYNLTQYNAAEYIDYFIHVEYIGTYLHLNGQTYQGTVALNGTPSATTVYVAKQFPGAIDQRTVNASTLDRITLNSVVTLNLGGIFILSGAAAGKVYRITNITKSEESQYAVTGLEFNDSIFDYIDSGIDITPLTGDFVNVDQFYTTDVESISWSDSSATNGSYSNSTLHLNWVWDSAKTQKYRANFRLSYSGPTANTVIVDQINTDNYDIPNPVPGRYIVTLWAVNPFTGISSKPKIEVVDFRINSTTVSTLQSPVNVRITGTTAVNPQPSTLTFTTPDLNITFDYNPDNQAVDDALGDYLLEVWEVAINPNTQAVSYTTLKSSYPIALEKGGIAVDPTSPETSYYPLNGSFQFPLSENLHVFGGTPSRTVGIKIYSRDLFGHVSANPVTVVVSNPVPAKILVADYKVVSGVSSVFVNIKASTEIDVKGYLVWRSTSPLFTKNSSTLVYDGPNNYVTLPVPTATKYWYSVAAYDNFSKTEYSPSDEQDSTPASADATTWTKTGLQFTANAATKTLSWTAGTIIRNATDSFNIAAGTSVWSTGFLYVYFNPSVSTTALQVTTTLLTAVQMGCYPLATYTGGDNSTIKGGDGNAFISGSQIIAGTVGASEIKAGSIVASLIDTTNAVITGTAQITDGIITNAKIGNSIMSLDYNPTTHKGWIIDKTGSIITYGSIGILDENGNVVFAGGNFNWNNAKGPGVPQVGATRNVFVGPWLTNTNYVIGDIVTDGLGYGWSCVTAHTSSAGVKTPVYPATSNSYWALYTVKGDSASSTTIVPIYRRVAGTNPSLPLPSGVTTYNFNSGTLTGLDNGWTKDVPAGTDPLYMSAATAVGVGTDTILTSEWATPVLFVSNGVNGTPGTNTATVTLYQTTATSAAPVVPNIPLTYKFSDATIAETLPNNWQRSLPTTGAYRWVTTATALGTGATDVIQAGEWAPTSLLAQDGINGLRTAILDMYQWAASPPTLFPSGSSTFTWSTGQFTAPPTTNNWYLTPQAPVKGQTLYVARTIYTDSLTATTTAINWTATTSTARSVAGIDGTPGTRTAYLEVYKWSANAPTTFPQGTSTYTWANGTFTDANVNTNGWLLVPGTSVQGQTLWGISQTYTDTGSSLSSPVTWSSISPYPLGYSGIDGQPGKTASTFGINNAAAVFNKNATNVISPSAGITLTTSYQNITGTLSYQWQKNGTNITGATSSSYTVPTSDYSSATTNTYKVTITGTINGVFGSLTDTITIPMLVDGGSGPVVLLSNDNIIFGAPNVLYSGIDFSNGTCDVTAYIGSTQLTYAASGANTFSLTYSSSSATVGAGSNPTSQILRIPAPTGMSAESATNTITITLRDASGIALPLVVKYLRYNLSRAGAVGMSYWLSNTDYLKRSTSLVYSPAAITLNGYSAAGSTTPAAYPCRFKIYEDGSATASYTSPYDEASKSYTPSTTAVSYIKVEMYLAGGTTTLVDYSTIPVVQDGSQGITLVEPNSAVLLPADSAGNVSSYSGSGTTIKVFEGSNQLTFTTGVVTKGYFGVSAAVSTGTVTVGGISGAYTTTCTIGNHSGLSTDLANITYTISIIKADGTSVVLTDIQTLTKSKAGAKGDLTPMVIVNGEQAFKYAADTTIPTNQTITLSASLSGGLTSYSWEYWYANLVWLPLSAPNTSSTYSLAYNSGAFGTSNSLRIRCLSSTAYDEITVVKLYDGAKGKDAITGYLTNESAALPADSAGTVSSYTGASGNFKVFSGTTDVTTSNCAYSVVAPNPASGVTISIGSTTGAYTASGTMNADAVSFTLNAVYSGVTPAVTVSKVLSLTRVKAGVAGVTTTSTIVADTVTVSGGQAFNYPAGNTTTPTGTGIITLTAFLTGTLTTYSWEYWTGSVWASLGGSSSIYYLIYYNSAFVGDTARIRCLSGTKFDEITIVKLYSGTNGKDSVVGYLTNETATFPADKDGVVSDYSVGNGQFKVFSGTTDITSGYSTTYSVTTATVSGLTLAINTAGAYTLSVSNSSLANAANSFTFEVKAVTSSTYGNVTVVKSIKYAKSKTGATGVGTSGADAVIGQLSSDSIMISCLSNGNPSGTSPYATVTMTVRKGSLDDSANWTYSVTLSNVTSNSLSTSRIQNVTGFDGGVTNQAGYIEFTASRTGYSSIVKRCVFAKSIQGIAGAGTSYTGASDPTPTNPAASINGDSYFQTTSQLMWVKVAGTWRKVIPQITGGVSGNAATFIATGAIGQAQIGSLAVGTAQIIDANVETLKIAGNAVTVPLASVVTTALSNSIAYSGTTYSASMCSLSFTNPSTTESIKILVTFGFSFLYVGTSTADRILKGVLFQDTTAIYTSEWATSTFITNYGMSAPAGAASSSLIVTVAAGATVAFALKHQKGAGTLYWNNAFITATGCRR